MGKTIIECEIAKWKGDINGLSSGIEKLKAVQYGMHVNAYTKILEKLKTGELKAVDLSFAPEKPVEEVVELSDQEKLAELEQAILDAKAEMAAAGAAGDEAAQQERKSR